MSTVAPDRVCVVIARTRHKMVQAELEEAVKRGAKFIELRLDYLTRAVDYKRLLPHKKCPWMATFRRGADGGRYNGDEEQRLIVIRQAIVSGAFEWIDLETDIADVVRRFGPVKRVISYHNTAETPADLEEIYDRMLKQDGDVYKLAVRVQTPQDVERILALQRTAPKPTVCFGMGDLGQPTRFIALKYGAPWIYCGFNKDREVAPGLPSLSDFRTTYPVRSIRAETKIFGVIGDPVAHSHSPVLHNHMLRRHKVDALYLPFRVPKGELEAWVKAYSSVPVSGYSVTIPHKEAALELAKEAEPNAQQTGAANTLFRRTDGAFFASNTDFTAVVEALKAHLDSRAEVGEPVPPLNQLFVLVLGAGGVARAVAHALHREHSHLYIASRTQERTEKLADEVKCKVTDWQARHSVNPCDVVVNCTPVGMHPNVDETPLHHGFLTPGLTVFDTVYNPENTLLVQEAKARGCYVLTGVELFVRQAARQFETFTGIDPDVDEMRELLRKAMSPLSKALDTPDEDTATDDDD